MNEKRVCLLTHSLAEDHSATSKRSKQNFRKSVQKGLLKTVTKSNQIKQKQKQKIRGWLIGYPEIFHKRRRGGGLGQWPYPWGEPYWREGRLSTESGAFFGGRDWVSPDSAPDRLHRQNRCRWGCFHRRRLPILASKQLVSRRLTFWMMSVVVASALQLYRLFGDYKSSFLFSFCFNCDYDYDYDNDASWNSMSYFVRSNGIWRVRWLRGFFVWEILMPSNLICIN